MGSPWISWSLPAAVTTGNTPACLHADSMAELQKLLLLWCWHLEGCTCSCVSHPCLPPSPHSGLGPLVRAGTLPSLWLGHLCGHPGVLGRQMSQAPLMSPSRAHRSLILSATDNTTASLPCSITVCSSCPVVPSSTARLPWKGPCCPSAPSPGGGRVGCSFLRFLFFQLGSPYPGSDRHH